MCGVRTFFNKNPDLLQKRFDYKLYHDLYESLAAEYICKQGILECNLNLTMHMNVASYLTLLSYYKSELPRLEEQTDQLCQMYTKMPFDFRAHYPDEAKFIEDQLKERYYEKVESISPGLY